MNSTFDEGDIVWLDFNPQSGKEQSGRRPAVVLTPKSYNSKTGLMIVCPITSTVKGYPFEVVIPEGQKVDGAILGNHIKSIDWEERNVEFGGHLPNSVLIEAKAKLKALLSMT